MFQLKYFNKTNHKNFKQFIKYTLKTYNSIYTHNKTCLNKLILQNYTRCDEYIKVQFITINNQKGLKMATPWE